MSAVSREPMRYWQYSDDPNWSDEKEAAFITELSLFNIENAMRPRDEFDVDIHPESFRAKVLALYDETARVEGQIRGALLAELLARLQALHRVGRN